MPQSFVISRARTVTNLNIYQRPACSAENQAEFRGIIQPGNILAKPKIAKPPHTHTHAGEPGERNNTADEISFLSLFPCYVSRVFFPPTVLLQTTSNEGETKKKKKYTLVEKRTSRLASYRETDSAASVITINCSPYDNYRYSWNGIRRESVFLRLLFTYSLQFDFSDPFFPLAQMAALNIRWNTTHTASATAPLLICSLNEFIN